MAKLVSDYAIDAKRGERMERVVEICDSADAARGHDFIEETEATNVKKNQQTEHTGMLDLKCILQSDM